MTGATALYDVPGLRTRRRQAVCAALSAVVILASATARCSPRSSARA
ncbi:hypothetical protein [Streptomyces olivaceoviridis]|nr:hypothetical protein [Streptomyces olivaceoviridis]